MSKYEIGDKVDYFVWEVGKKYIRTGTIENVINERVYFIQNGNNIHTVVSTAVIGLAKD